LACRDAFVHLRASLPIGTLEQEKMAVLVDVTAAKAEVPIDYPYGTVENEVVQTGLLCRLAQCCLGRRLVTLEMTLGEPPILVGVPDQQEFRGLP
jgi:hypothetical protein